MSNVSTQHSILAFVKGVSKALTGQILMRALKHNGTVINKCVSVPALPASIVQDTRFHSAFLAYLESTRQEMFKMVCFHAPNQTSISEDEIGANAIYAYLESQAAGERLSAESIKRWFTGMAQDALMAAVASRIGIDLDTELTPEQEATIIGSVAALAGMIELLAARNVSLGEKQKKAIQFVFDNLPPEADSHTLTGKIQDRFQLVCSGKIEEDMLGFLMTEKHVDA